MKNDFFEENWKPIVALALGVGVGALIAKSLMSSEAGDNEALAPNQFPSLKIEKEYLFACNGKYPNLTLDYMQTQGGHVILKLVGSAPGEPKYMRPLKIDQRNFHSAENQGDRNFKYDASRTPLYDLIAADRSTIRDWWLEPYSYPEDRSLVSYRLTDRLSGPPHALAVYRLNPSPPA